MSIGKRIREIRGNLSRKAFAERVQIVENTLRNYEDDLSLPNIDVSSKICREYGVSLLWFAEGVGPMRPGENAPEPAPQAEKQPVTPDISPMQGIMNELLADNRALNAEYRQLMKENAGLREENATLRERLKNVSGAGMVDARSA